MGTSNELITSIYWAPTAEKKAYSRYFVTLHGGGCLEVTVHGLKPCKLPAYSHNMNNEFIDILNKAKIHEVRTDERTDVAILLDSGHIMLLTSTFDGNEPGNNFFLQSPSDAAEWKQEFQQMRRL